MENQSFKAILCNIFRKRYEQILMCGNILMIKYTLISRLISIFECVCIHTFITFKKQHRHNKHVVVACIIKTYIYYPGTCRDHWMGSKSICYLYWHFTSSREFSLFFTWQLYMPPFKKHWQMFRIVVKYMFLIVQQEIGGEWFVWI